MFTKKPRYLWCFFLVLMVTPVFAALNTQFTITVINNTDYTLISHLPAYPGPVITPTWMDLNVPAHSQNSQKISINQNITYGPWNNRQLGIGVSTLNSSTLEYANISGFLSGDNNGDGKGYYINLTPNSFYTTNSMWLNVNVSNTDDNIIITATHALLKK